MDRTLLQHAVPALFLVVAVGCGDPPPETGPRSDAASPERVVAVVNGSEIPARRLEQVRAATRITRAAEGLPLEAGQSAEGPGSDLDLLINAELLYQDALAHGVSAGQTEIEEQLQVIRSQFVDEADFHAYLDEAGLTEAMLSEDVKRRLVLSAWAETLTDDLELDPERAHDAYLEQRSVVDAGEQVRVAQIVILVRPGATSEKRRLARAKIEEARRQIEAGAEFADVARGFSESPFAERGGDLGFFPRGRTLPEFEAVVFSTPVGETSGIFETPHGFNIIRVLGRRTASADEYPELQTGLLMVQAREQRNAVLREHVIELRSAATIEILDAGSR